MSSRTSQTPSWSSLIESLPVVPEMPEGRDATEQARPFIYRSLRYKALHFSITGIQSRMLVHDPYALDLEYTQTMLGFLLFSPSPESLVMIGLGGGSIAKFCHRHLPGTRIQVVEINPQVIALREEFHIPPDDERLAVLCGDGAQFVRQSTERVDTLLVDGFDLQGLPGRLCSQRFYNDCADRLQPGGIMVANLQFDHADYKKHLRRIRKSFDDAVLVVDDDELNNSIVFASKGRTWDLAKQGSTRRPRGLKPDGAEQLRSAFSRIKATLINREFCDTRT